MTNEQRRRGSGAANAAERLASDGGAARRAVGDALVERRTGKSQVDDLNSVVNQPRPRQQLKPITPRGSIPAQTSPGTNTPNPVSSGGGGGIASPLTERLVGGKADRIYHPDNSVFYSNDYMLAVAVQPLKQLNMIDADGATATMIFGVPAQ
jgi:hypothetical protein